MCDISINMDLRWREDARTFTRNRQRILAARPQIVENLDRIRAGGLKVAEEYLSDIVDRNVLDDHQAVNVAAMTLPSGCGLCLFDEQGAGKTVSMIFAFDLLISRDEVDFALIVAPKSMVSEWAHDFTRFKGDLYKVVVAAGPRIEKRRALSSRADVIVTNYETTVTMEAELRAMLRRRQGRAMLVVDESYFIKNLNAQRTGSLRRLREYCRRAYVLCGTPAPNAPEDLVEQFNIVDFGTTFGDLEVPDDRDAAVGVVQSAIDSRGLYLRHLKSAVLPDLPLKRFHRVIVPMCPQQQRLYSAALDSLRKDLLAVDDLTFKRRITSFLARRVTLLQLCSNPTPLVKGYGETPAKLAALDRILDDLITQRGEKVIVWSFYTGSLDAVVQRYSRFNPVRYDGSVTDVGARRQAVQKFQEDDETMLFVANPAAAGAGLTLHRARVAVFESFSNQAAHYLQSLDRIHRRGQTREVEYIVLLCEDTTEIGEYDRLIQKQRASETLLGDPPEGSVTRETMLQELEQASALHPGA
ncbi:DEAD/DEAH box helicase [Elusimicrobiota bacterium]